ncbi:hypothetical protein V8C26DRAFT_289176 [Trichoderma gracile]
MGVREKHAKRVSVATAARPVHCCLLWISTQAGCRYLYSYFVHKHWRLQSLPCPVQAEGRVALEGIVAFPCALPAASGTGFAARQSSYRTPCVCLGSASCRLCSIAPVPLALSLSSLSLLSPCLFLDLHDHADVLSVKHSRMSKQTRRQAAGQWLLLRAPSCTEYYEGGLAWRGWGPSPLPWFCCIVSVRLWWTGIFGGYRRKKRVWEKAVKEAAKSHPGQLQV